MGSLSIIHLSDIHIKNSDDTILKRYEEISKACVSCVKDKSTLVIVVSGDIAYSGECEQYKLATKFFENIKQYIENEKNIKVEVVISPGNHDCDFSENSSVRDILINNINPTDIDQEYVNNVIAKQKHFYDFVLQYYDDMNNRICWEKEISIDNNDVLFVSVNSAWMSELHEQPGKLVIPQSFLPVIDLNDYEAVIYVCHHPLNWLNPDYKTPFIDHLRNNADIVLFGHEHYKDNYIQTGKTYELINYHGKELQNSKSSESGFSIIAFDDDFKSYNVKDYEWVENRIYNRINDNDRVFERNKAIRSVYSVNESLLDYIDDIGINVKHFAKENIVLSDLFIWPDLIKSDYKNEKSGSVRISDNYFKELCENKLSIIVGESTSGKTTLSKQLFRSELNAGRCCILAYGQNFTTSTENAIIKTIEETYKKQYSGDYLEEFRQLPRKNKTLIIDNFDSIQNNNNRRSKVIDCVSNQFDTVVILMASSFAITTLLKSEVINSSDELYYYEIKPFGNKKRKDFISKWYKLIMFPTQKKQ